MQKSMYKYAEISCHLLYNKNIGRRPANICLCKPAVPCRAYRAEGGSADPVRLRLVKNITRRRCDGTN